MDPVRLIVYSDYLCPWCYVAAMRLDRLERELGEHLDVEWRSFLLRPEPGQRPRTLEEFKGYTESWQRPAAEEPEARFQEWRGAEGPPSHSIPPHLAAKAAATLGPESFGRLHTLLFESYFRNSRDITDERVLRELWSRAELPEDAWDKRNDPELLRQVMMQHNEALQQGAGGVPAVRVRGRYGVLMGAQPLEIYRRWVLKMAEAQGAATGEV